MLILKTNIYLSILFLYLIICSILQTKVTLFVMRKDKRLSLRNSGDAGLAQKYNDQSGSQKKKGFRRHFKNCLN